MAGRSTKPSCPRRTEVLVIRFGHDWDPTCMKMDEVLYSIVEKVLSSYCVNSVMWDISISLV